MNKINRDKTRKERTGVIIDEVTSFLLNFTFYVYFLTEAKV